jgi:hypothetical protein
MWRRRGRVEQFFGQRSGDIKWHGIEHADAADTDIVDRCQ